MFESEGLWKIFELTQSVSCDAAGSKQKKKKKSVILDKNKFGNPMFAIQDQVIHFTFVPVF